MRVSLHDGGLHVVLVGLDRLLVGRREVAVDAGHIVAATSETRTGAESLVDHRVRGIGAHRGSKRPGGRRVGVMLGRAVEGPQFWAVRPSHPEQPLLVLDLHGHEFARVVVAVDDADEVADALSRRCG